MARSLAGHPHRLSYLAVDGAFGAVVVWGSTVPGTVPLLLGLALGFFLFLLGLPLLANFFEFCRVMKLVPITHVLRGAPS